MGQESISSKAKNLPKVLWDKKKFIVGLCLTFFLGWKSWETYKILNNLGQASEVLDNYKYEELLKNNNGQTDPALKEGCKDIKAQAEVLQLVVQAKERGDSDSKIFFTAADYLSTCNITNEEFLYQIKYIFADRFRDRGDGELYNPPLLGSRGFNPIFADSGNQVAHLSIALDGYHNNDDFRIFRSKAFLFETLFTTKIYHLIRDGHYYQGFVEISKNIWNYPQFYNTNDGRSATDLYFNLVAKYCTDLLKQGKINKQEFTSLLRELATNPPEDFVTKFDELQELGKQMSQ